MENMNSDSPPIPPRKTTLASSMNNQKKAITADSFSNPYVSNDMSEIFSNGDIEGDETYYTNEEIENLENHDFSPQNRLVSTSTPNKPFFPKPESSFQRTRSLGYRKQQKNSRLLPNKSLTIPRRKYYAYDDMNSVDFELSNSDNHSNPHNDNHHVYSNNNGSALSQLREENVVVDLTEKIITNINDHLERVERTQSGELERDNKILQRDNAILKEKIRMLEDLLRENEVKSDAKISELLAQNRSYMHASEREKAEQTQQYIYKIDKLESRLQENESVNERLSHMAETYKREHEKCEHELKVSQNTNQKLRQDFDGSEARALKLTQKLEKIENNHTSFFMNVHQTLIQMQSTLNTLTKEPTMSQNESISETVELNENNVVEPKITPEMILNICLNIQANLEELQKKQNYISAQKREIWQDILDTKITNNTLEKRHTTNTLHETTNQTEQIFNHNNNTEPVQNLAHELTQTQCSSNENVPNPTLLLKQLTYENQRLRQYIDKLLLIILERQPALLEITNNCNDHLATNCNRKNIESPLNIIETTTVMGLFNR